MTGAAWLADATRADLAVEEVGGKAFHLARLTRAGLPVPPWFCVTTRAGDELRAAAGNEVERGIDAAILARFDAAFAPGALVAVRSSGVGEDSARASFAGQMDTYLYVPRDEVPERVRACLASASSARAKAYRRARGLALDGIKAGVVVQQIVDSQKAGVLFTAEPTTGRRDRAVISAGLGLGEGVVSDQVETDTLVIDRASGAVVERRVAEKRGRVVFDRARGRGTHLEPVPAPLAHAPVLTDEEAVALARLGDRIEALYEEPQDIEWAIDESGRLHILQARPITTLASEPEPASSTSDDRELIFDNANIVESFPGIVSPLTFSFARRGYRTTFRATSRRFGVPESIVRESDDAYENLVALIDGRMYYNIINWYRILSLIPGFEGLLPAWERALGLEPQHVRRPAPPSGLRERLRRRRLFLGVVRTVLSLFFRLDRHAARFAAAFAEAQAAFRRRDVDRLTPHELVDLDDELGRRLLEEWSITIVNDFFAQQLYDALGKLIRKYELAADDSLRNDLLCGETGMESVEPVRSVLGLAAAIRADPRLRALFEAPGRDERDVIRAVREEPAFAGFRAALDLHLERYGDRTLHELKLETPGAAEDPRFLVRMLRTYVRGEQSIEALEAREREIRAAAEARVEAALAGRPLRRRLFRFVLERCRRSVKYRENMRLARTRAYGMAKRIFRALGRAFARDGLIERAENIFYLTIDEVRGHVRGAAVTRDLGRLVALRRAEYEAFAARPAPADRVVTRGIVYANLVAAGVPAGSGSGSVSDEGGELRGIGCSPGRATGRARIVLEPADAVVEEGTILVAPMTDPGWVFLMIAARGIVVEKGSLLSHTAIIGRELGIPTVVGVKDATRKIADGREVEIDGTRGTVRLA